MRHVEGCNTLKERILFFTFVTKIHSPSPSLLPFLPATYIPEHLSVTLNQGDDLSLRFTEAAQRAVLWQKEPVAPSGWSKAVLTADDQLIIPNEQLNGPGFYSVTSDTESGDPDSNTQEYGTFSLLISSKSKTNTLLLSLDSFIIICLAELLSE